MELRSNKTLEGRKMAGARALWRANGMKREQFGKQIGCRGGLALACGAEQDRNQKQEQKNTHRHLRALRVSV